MSAAITKPGPIAALNAAEVSISVAHQPRTHARCAENPGQFRKAILRFFALSNASGDFPVMLFLTFEKHKLARSART